MKTLTHILVSLFIVLLLVANVDQAHAGHPKYLFKVASLAPEGSVWTQTFRNFTKEVEEKSNGEIGFKIYAGGVMGDDRAMYRKMRVGQINGGGFTMTGISEVVPDFRALGIPFMFNTYDEVDRVKEKLLPRFEKEFNNGFYSSPMIVDGKLYIVDMRGVTHILKADASGTIIAEPELGEDGFAAPAMADGLIYIRGEEHLYCIGN